MTAPPIPAAPSVPAPAELPVRLAPGVRVRAGGRFVRGGSPLRVLLLTGAGAGAVQGWRGPAAAPVGDGEGRRRLARRLLDAGLLVPDPPPAESTVELTVVVPVRDRPGELARCLEAVRAACPQSPVIVVDDGSADPGAVATVCGTRPAAPRLIRRAVSGGPAAARNDGLAGSDTPYVLFVDSDAVLPPDAARRLLGHLTDQSIGVVAPRIRALPAPRGPIAGYEARHSPLDMGPRPGPAAPRRALSYVPSTVLLARRAALGDGGFDPALRTGEDVDLVWRLTRAGWVVRYVPEVEVGHEHRVRLRAFVAGRLQYARSIGTLARRHPDCLPAVWLSPALAVIWLAVLAGRPAPAVASAAWTVARRAERLERFRGGRWSLAADTLARGLGATGLGLAHAARRAWLPPLLLVTAVHRRGRRRTHSRTRSRTHSRSRTRAHSRSPTRALAPWLLAAFSVPLVQDAVRTPDPRIWLGDAPLRLLDEVLAAAGTWDGCLRARTVRPLLPSFRGMAA